MPVTKPMLATSIIASILSLCGTPIALAQSSAPIPNNAQRTAIVDAKILIAQGSLNLQKGDTQSMRQALASPIRFKAVERSREFTGQLIVHSKEDRVPTAVDRLSQTVVKSSQSVNEYVINVPKGLTESEMASMLMATGDYLFVEPNWKLYPLSTVPNDPQFASSWQHTRLQSTNAWDIHTGESDVIVAICDSGVDEDHPDLQDALVSGFNAVDNLAQADGGQVADLLGHGSFVSGCAAAQGNNGTGVTGVGWDLGLMPVRVSNSPDGTANSFDITEGARWAVDHGAKAINISFSGGADGSNQSTARYIIEQGGLLFWASGNDNQLVTNDAIDLVLVGSTTSSDTKSGFSNFGPAVDVVAPGSSVRSTNRFGGYTNDSGTSYASPIAAGVGAMIFSVRSDLSGYDVQDILYQSVDDLGTPGRDDSFGRGRVNTFNAMQLAQTYTKPIALPISESFETASWLDLFTATSGTPTTIVDPESTGSGSVLVLDSTDQTTTVPIAGRTTSTPPALNFGFKVAGVEAGETYSFEYRQDDGTWAQLIDYTATGTDTDGYIPVALTLPNNVRRHGVLFRITASGSDATDQWMFDNLTIDDPDIIPVVPFVDSFESGIVSDFKWLQTLGTEVQVSASTHATSITEASLLVSQTVPMMQFGFVPGFVRLDAWTDGNAGPDDVLQIEIRTVLGSWDTLATLPGDSLTNSPETFEFQTPISSWAIDTLQIRITSTGNDAFLVDNFYIGPDMLTASCSPADFAEPFGALNFLDVSAFLDAFAQGSTAADLDESGSLNFLDVSEFLNIFGQGCP